MSKFLNSRLKHLKEYTPGEQPQDKKYIKLNTNESPFPPSKKVLSSITRGNIENLRLYCNPDATLLKSELAGAYGVKTENVFVSNGSDDILNFAFLAFGEDGVMFPDVTYGFYEVFARLHGLEYQKVPLNEDFTVNKEDYLSKNKLIVIANPNAPTGILLPLSEVEEIVKSNGESVVLIDEAYVDFGGESAVSLTEKYANLLVVMTFSKSRSMAGARLGFAIGSRELIADLEKIKYSTNPYSVNSLTQALGVATLKDDAYCRDNCKKIIKNREFTVIALERLGFSVLPSSANFIFAKSAEISGKELYLRLKEEGILVRHFDADRIKDYNRITIGNRKEMEALVLAVKKILDERK